MIPQITYQCQSEYWGSDSAGTEKGQGLLEAFQTLLGVAESENKYKLLNPQSWQGTSRDTCGEGHGRAGLLQAPSATLQLQLILPSALFPLSGERS